MNKGVVQITFSNHTFNVELKEGESIDLRLKNENGYIYMGKANDETNRNQKSTGYSTAGLIHPEQKQEEPDSIQESESESDSSIFNVLNSKQHKKQETKETPEDSNVPDVKIHEQEDEVKLQKSNNLDESNSEYRVSAISQNEETNINSTEDDSDSKEDDEQDSILRRYVPEDDDEE
ncbi:hypothetical protein KXP69_002269 [Staphylococcus pseudintermedius]|nr:hypothetical protein [Staphylococcus pseudintermedius]MDE9937883.1 hypothetical protein [Staphylococcus pseudintermedius]